MGAPVPIVALSGAWSWGGRIVTGSLVDSSLPQQLDPLFISCFGSWRSCTGRAGSSRQGHHAAAFSWQDGVIFPTSARSPGSHHASPGSRVGKQCSQSQLGCVFNILYRGRFSMASPPPLFYCIFRKMPYLFKGTTSCLCVSAAKAL